MAKVPVNDPKHWRERAEGLLHSDAGTHSADGIVLGHALQESSAGAPLRRRDRGCTRGRRGSGCSGSGGRRCTSGANRDRAAADAAA